MARKQVNISSSTLFTGLMIAGLILLFLPQRYTKKLNYGFFRLFDPALRIGQGAKKVFRPTPSQQDSVAREKYDQLWATYNNLWADFTSLHEKNARLAGLQTARPSTGGGMVLAEVIITTSMGGKHEFVINKGSLDNLKVGQYVIDEKNKSIIGTIGETSQTEARVRLVTDTGHNIAIVITKPGNTAYIPAQMFGKGKSLCKVPLVPRRKHDVRVGDTVYAAARPGFLETARVIGEIVEAKPDKNKPLLWDISVKPITNPIEVRNLTIIVMGLEDADK